ncbi:hypothetical protein, partial [uncultured Thiocystis sp.]|uniref:hypothetical protein n=1 Tax=uncultured Thiocystis sp. TaxID=1202134 RepID=UPI0025DDA31A
YASPSLLPRLHRHQSPTQVLGLGPIDDQGQNTENALFTYVAFLLEKLFSSSISIKSISMFVKIDLSLSTQLLKKK